TKAIPDDQWEQYVMAGYNFSRKYGHWPKVSMAMFTEGFPSARQRGYLADHLKKHRVPPLVRVGILTDNALIRGAMTAFGWIMPRTSLRAFEERDVAGCLTWLKSGGDFDVAKASAAWSEARRTLGLDG